ncbi:hypothetical protein FACS1894126_0580 [Alphaproteobacteria bacterium]|nr:hypothetical protein FACS1894126_0580 [Alphaproteobacteria bacterium]
MRLKYGACVMAMMSLAAEFYSANANNVLYRLNFQNTPLIVLESATTLPRIEAMITGQRLPPDVADALPHWRHTDEEPSVPGVIFFVANLTDLSWFAYLVLTNEIRSGAIFPSRILTSILDTEWKNSKSGINGRLDLLKELHPLLLDQFNPFLGQFNAEFYSANANNVLYRLNFQNTPLIVLESARTLPRIEAMITGQNLPPDVADALPHWRHTEEEPSVPGVISFVANLTNLSWFAYLVLTNEIRYGAIFPGRILTSILDTEWKNSKSGINGRLDLLKELHPLLLDQFNPFLGQFNAE